MTSGELCLFSSPNFTRIGLCKLCCHFAKPVRLPGCGHSFCQRCILQYCKGRQRAACPLCREDFERKDLRPNRELAALVNLIRQEVKEDVALETAERTRNVIIQCYSSTQLNGTK
uniref:RING-type domain-containing protein n=1 Tax=Strigops habroptila TaxID=2489341 RepID=A0A672VF84_STRHB